MQGITVAHVRPRLWRESMRKMGPAVRIETGSMSLRAVEEKGREVGAVNAAARRCGGRWKIEGRMALRGCRDAMVDRRSTPMA